MSKRLKLTKIVELTASGFIRESTKQVRNAFTVETTEVLDPYPDAYKVWMKRVTIKKRGKSNKTHTEWMIARPMEGHKPIGGYDVVNSDGSTERFEMFMKAKHRVEVLVESWIDGIIDGGGSFEP